MSPEQRASATEQTPPMTPPRCLLLIAPHRGMFFLGVLQSVLVMVPWWIELLLRTGGGGLDWPWPPAWWHALMLIYGVFPFFIFGFILTAMPRWQSLGDLSPARYAFAWWLLVAGWLLVYAGFVWPSMRVLGFVCVAAGWGGVCLSLLPVALRGGRGRMHALPVWLAMLAGLSGWCLLVGMVITGDGAWVLSAIHVGLWCFLAPIFLSVCHRMVPFFSSSVLPDYEMVRPPWALYTLLGGVVAHGMFSLWSDAQLSWIVDLPLALLGGWLSIRWQLRRSFSVRLLAMLHLGFAWFAIAMALFGVDALLQWWGHPGLGWAPVHALVIGMFSVLVLAMVSRVTLGHSGAALAADSLTWRLMWLLHLVAAVRILAEWLPGRNLWLVLAATGWLVVFVAWGMRYLPVYLRPRVDGRPG